MNRRKKIIALALAFTLLAGVSACKKRKLSLDINNSTKQEQLSGNLYKEDIKNCFIVESIDDDCHLNLSLVYDEGNNKELYTKYGEVISITPFKNYIEEYSEDKEVYSNKDIEEILNKIKDNYKNIKKLELK